MHMLHIQLVDVTTWTVS